MKQPAVQMVPTYPYPPQTMHYPPPTPYVTPAYQPVYQPNIHSQWWQESSSVKSMSDIQSFMASRKIKDIPHALEAQSIWTDADLL